jgi:hypothetical protein
VTLNARDTPGTTVRETGWMAISGNDLSEIHTRSRNRVRWELLARVAADYAVSTLRVSLHPNPWSGALSTPASVFACCRQPVPLRAKRIHASALPAGVLP